MYVKNEAIRVTNSPEVFKTTIFSLMSAGPQTNATPLTRSAGPESNATPLTRRSE